MHGGLQHNIVVASKQPVDIKTHARFRMPAVIKMSKGKRTEYRPWHEANSLLFTDLRWNSISIVLVVQTLTPLKILLWTSCNTIMYTRFVCVRLIYVYLYINKYINTHRHMYCTIYRFERLCWINSACMMLRNGLFVINLILINSWIS